MKSPASAANTNTELQEDALNSSQGQVSNDGEINNGGNRQEEAEGYWTDERVNYLTCTRPDNFEKGFAALTHFLKVHGCYPKKYEDVWLYKWIKATRTAVKYGALPAALKEKLNTLPFAWSQRNFNWDIQYSRAEQMLYAEMPLVYEERTFGWIERQVKAYKEGSLTEYEKGKIEKLLQLIPQADAEMSAEWNSNYDALIEWRKTHAGEWPAYDDASVKALVCWCRILEFQLHFNLLNEEWQTKLDYKTPELQTAKGKRWLLRFEELKKHLEQHGSQPDKSKWGLYQRYRWLVNGYAASTPEQKALFDSLQIERPTLRKKWQEYYSELLQHMDVNGQLPTPTSDKVLSDWLNIQIYFGVVKKLSADKCEKLNALGVSFVPKVHNPAKLQAYGTVENYNKWLEEKWHKRLAELVMFRLQHPDRWPRIATERELYQWCTAQKQAARGEHRYKLPQERVEKLTALGFSWGK